MNFWRDDPVANYVLATVVQVEGSSYRKPGARMLIHEKGQAVGAISGGCLEEDVRRQVGRVLTNKSPKLLSYETTDDDMGERAIKLGCNGKIHILMQPILANQRSNVMSALQAAMTDDVAIAQFYSFNPSLNSQLTEVIYKTKQGENIDVVLHLSSSEHIINDLRVNFNLQQSTHQEYEWQGKKYYGFFHFCTPPVSLVIVGAGYDVKPLVRMANILGWKTTIVTRKPPRGNKFPEIDELILAAEPSKAIARLKFNSSTAVVLMSHNYEYDKLFLAAFLQLEIPYLGMLGPRSKLSKIRSEWVDNEVFVREELWNQLHSPIGLNIGAACAEEIAVAIVAEILNRFAQRRA